jgi:hypothetical protein
MIILITNYFPVTNSNGIPTGETKLLVDWAFDYDTGENFVFPCASPQSLGAEWDDTLKEWVLL